MIVLYVLGGVLGGLMALVLALLALLLVVSLFPVQASLAFRGEFFLELRVLFLRIPLLPGREEPEKDEPEPEAEQPREGQEKKSSVGERMKRALKREGLSGFLEALGELVRLAGGASAGILRGLRLKEFDLYLCLGGSGDAAQAAVLYGQVSGGVYSACGALFGLLPCKKKGVTVDLDYSAGEPQVDFSARLSIRPVVILWEGLKLFFKSLRPLKRIL